MKKQQIGILQREKGLLSLIEDAEKYNFNEVLIKDYKQQLKEIQEEIKSIKEKGLIINTIERRLN